MPIHGASFLLRYGCAAVSVGLATWVRLLLNPILGNQFPIATILLAVLATSWYGGFRPALAAAGLGAVATILIMRPQGRFFLEGMDQHVGMLLYGCSSLGIALVGGALRAANEGLESRVRERTAELTKTNESLQTSEERYRLLIEGAQDYANFMLDPGGHVITWNTGAERLKGYHADEIKGRHFSCFYSEGDVACGKPERELQEAVTEGRCMDEGWRIRKDGTRFWARVAITPLYDKAGQLRGFAKVTRDITEGMRAQLAMRDSEERFRMMANSIPQLACIARADGHIFWFNRRWYDFTGTTPEQMEGWGWQSVHDPAVLPEVMARWKGAIDAGKPFEMVFPLRGADGRFRTFLTRVEPFRDSEGRVVQWFGTNTDVDELKRLEESLRASQARLNSTLAAGSIGTWTWDIANDRLAADEFTARMFSIDPAAAANGLPAQDYLRAVLEEDQRSVADALARAIQSCGHYEIEYRVRPKDGGLHWLQAKGRVEGDSAGNALYFHGAVMDITERKHAERALQQVHAELEERVVERTAQLEAANKELEAFSYSVSHDLRAPLRAIAGFSKILLKSYAAVLPTKAQDYLQDVHRNTLHMGHLVDDLLAFSRLSRQPVKKVTIATGELVRQCLDDLRGDHVGRQVDIRIGELPPCLADPALLKQVWFNLLANALKYTNKREATIIEIGSRVGDDPGKRTYFVKDNGVGFDMEYAHKLFGVFQRLHRSEDYEGTGVGLAIVQRIIHRHGGRIWAEAEPDRGATFYFSLEEGKTLHE